MANEDNTQLHVLTNIKTWKTDETCMYNLYSHSPSEMENSCSYAIQQSIRGNKYKYQENSANCIHIHIYRNINTEMLIWGTRNTFCQGSPYGEINR